MASEFLQRKIHMFSVTVINVYKSSSPTENACKIRLLLKLMFYTRKNDSPKLANFYEFHLLQDKAYEHLKQHVFTSELYCIK